MEIIMDSEQLQKLANLATIRQHAAAVTSSTNFPRKYINDVNKTLGILDSEFIKLLVEAVKTSDNFDPKDALTISQRLAEEKAKLKIKADSANEVVGTVPNKLAEELVKESVRPTIKTARGPKKKNEATTDEE